MKTINYTLILISMAFINCSNSTTTGSDIKLIKFSKECILDFLDEHTMVIENNFLRVDSTKQVKYSISNGVLSCKIYTTYDCLYEKTLQGSFIISDNVISIFMETKSNGLSSTCVCPSYLTYNFTDIDPNKKYIVRYVGVKYR